MSQSRPNDALDAPPTTSIVVTVHSDERLPPPAEPLHRAVHKIRLSALCKNFAEVESAANRQRCSVIVVVKADGYGHGAIATALFLADYMGADAFAVATLEEGIALRKAFQQTPPGSSFQSTHSQSMTTKNATGTSTVAKSHVSSLFHAQSETQTNLNPPSAANKTGIGRRRLQRPSQIRILVLGPPINFPKCFSDYFFYNIEVMISGPEVAKALLEWVCNTEERKRIQVERAAAETKELAMNLQGHALPPQRPAPTTSILDKKDSNLSDFSSGEYSEESVTASDPAQRFHPPSATLSNCTGMDLAKEVRKILKNQKLATNPSPTPSATQHGTTRSDMTCTTSNTPASNGPSNATTQIFAGIEETAKISRSRHKAIARGAFVDSGEEDQSDTKPSNPTTQLDQKPLAGLRKRLRWHALVDSGMGRLGFRTDPVLKAEQGKRRDTVDILNELVDLETSLESPIEFFGVCTHMADANSTSDYTHSQIAKFKSLLRRVRAAGISVPTISTDNSAALLTTNLTHFDPKELLTQEFTDTRGFVRTGGAIYGQRPSFSQIKAISTLVASVRHVATLKKGESVGYDRAYIAPLNMRIATLAIGFADGYPRDLGNGVGKVAIRGSLFPVAGNVCMDMMMVELGPAEDRDCPGAQVVVGDTAVLWGPGDDEDGGGLVRLQDIACLLKTTQSALTCGLDKERVLRQYE